MAGVRGITVTELIAPEDTYVHSSAPLGTVLSLELLRHLLWRYGCGTAVCGREAQSRAVDREGCSEGPVVVLESRVIRLPVH